MNQGPLPDLPDGPDLPDLPRAPSPALAPLEDARRALANAAPDAAAEARVLARLQADYPPAPAVAAAAAITLARHTPWRRYLATSAGLLATALVLLVLGPPGPRRAAQAGLDSGFLPLVSQDEWRRTLADQREMPVWLMPAEVPRQQLASLGLPFDASRADETLRAELMVHPSTGRLLAVRFLP
jgi:hypothetical protein